MRLAKLPRARPAPISRATFSASVTPPAGPDSTSLCLYVSDSSVLYCRVACFILDMLCLVIF